MKELTEVLNILIGANNGLEGGDLHASERKESIDKRRNVHGFGENMKKVPCQANYPNKFKTDNLAGRNLPSFNVSNKGTSLKQIPLTVVRQGSKPIYLNKQCNIPVYKRKSDMLLSSNPSAQVVLSERKMEIKELESQVVCLKEKIKELKIENKTLVDIQARQDREIRKYETGIADIPSLMKDHKEEKKVLELNLNSIKTELKDSQKELKLKQDALLRKTKQIEKLNTEVRKYNIMKQNLTVENKNLKLVNEEHKKEVSVLKSENMKLQRKIQLIMKYIAQLKSNPENCMVEDFEEMFSRMDLNDDFKTVMADVSNLNKQNLVVTQCIEEKIQETVLDKDTNEELKEITMERSSSPNDKNFDNQVISETKKLYCAKSSPKELCVGVKDSEKNTHPVINVTTLSNVRSFSKEDIGDDIVLKSGDVFQDPKIESNVNYFTKESYMLNSKEISCTNAEFQKNCSTAVENTNECNEVVGLKSCFVFDSTGTKSAADYCPKELSTLETKEMQPTDSASQNKSVISVENIREDSKENTFPKSCNIFQPSKAAPSANCFAKESFTLLSRDIRSSYPASQNKSLIAFESSRGDSKNDTLLNSGNILQNSKAASFANCFAKELPALPSNAIKLTDPASQNKYLITVENTKEGSKEDVPLKSSNVFQLSKAASFANCFTKESSPLQSKVIKPTDTASQGEKLFVAEKNRKDSKEDTSLKSVSIFQDFKAASFVNCFTRESSSFQSKEIKPTDPAYPKQSLNAVETTGENRENGFLKSSNVFQDSKPSFFADFFRKKSSVLGVKEIKPIYPASQKNSFTANGSTHGTDSESLIEEEIFDFSEPEVFSSPECVTMNNTNETKNYFCPNLLEESSGKCASPSDTNKLDKDALSDFYDTLNISNIDDKYLYNSKIFDQYLKKHSWKYHS